MISHSKPIRNSLSAMTASTTASFPAALAVAAIWAATMVLSGPALSVTIGSWDPTSVGIGGQFGTFTSTPPITFSGDGGIFIPDPNIGGIATFNSNAESFGMFEQDTMGTAFSAARAVATLDLFGVGVETTNNRDNSVAPFFNAPLPAGAAAATNYFVDLSGGFTGTSISAFLGISGSFPSSNLGGNFVYIEVEVNELNAAVLIIAIDSRGSVVFESLYSADGSSFVEVNHGQWEGFFNLPFNIPIFPEVGRIDVRMFGESQSFNPGEGLGNALDFLGTATLTIDTPEGAFVGLATGLAYLADGATPVPEPSTLAIFAFGLAGLGLMRRRRKLN